VEDSRHYDIRPTATRLLVVTLIFDELFLPLGQPNHLKGGASRPSLYVANERPGVPRPLADRGCILPLEGFPPRGHPL
jgi:hypothetical protein